VAAKGIAETNIVTQHDEPVSPYTIGIGTGMRNTVVQSNCASDCATHIEVAAAPVAAGYASGSGDSADQSMWILRFTRSPETVAVVGTRNRKVRVPRLRCVTVPSALPSRIGTRASSLPRDLT